MLRRGLGVHIPLFARYVKQHNEGGEPHLGNSVHVPRKPVTQRKPKLKPLLSYEKNSTENCYHGRKKKNIECLVEAPLIECGMKYTVHASQFYVKSKKSEWTIIHCLLLIFFKVTAS